MTDIYQTTPLDLMEFLEDFFHKDFTEFFIGCPGPAWEEQVPDWVQESFNQLGILRLYCHDSRLPSVQNIETWFVAMPSHVAANLVLSGLKLSGWVPEIPPEQMQYIRYDMTTKPVKVSGKVWMGGQWRSTRSPREQIRQRQQDEINRSKRPA